MDERYVAFDVETPNAQNRRMSAIGVCVICLLYTSRCV